MGVGGEAGEAELRILLRGHLKPEVGEDGNDSDATPECEATDGGVQGQLAFLATNLS